MTKYRKLLLICVLVILLSAPGCLSNWEITLSNTKGFVDTLNKNSVTLHINNSIEVVDSIQLGQLFYASGFSLIDEITITEKSGESQLFTWDEIAENTTINKTGVVNIGDAEIKPLNITITLSPLLNDISYSILDISPTVVAALGMHGLENAEGQSLIKSNEQYKQVVMILMDGVQFEKFNTMVEDNLLPFFNNQGNINMGLTVYPPITTSATAALLTSQTPEKNGVFGYGYRSTDQTTLFDLAVQNNLSVIAIEGASLPFNLRNADTSLSGDQDGNGYSDDNVMINSLETIQNNLPDLLYIHFHEVDDMGHAFGENSFEYENALIRVDNYIEQIYKALPAHTLVIIFADHGMHTTLDGGNHGNLIAHDLIIPIILITK